MRRLATLLLALALAACAASCGPKPQPAEPAFWEVDGPAGRQAWLFGTIHSLDRPALWRSDPIDRALGKADRLVVEVANLNDQRAIATEFAHLSESPGHPLLSKRVRPELQDNLAELLGKAGLKDNQFGRIETWAAALLLARAADNDTKSKYGVDRALIEDAGDMPVVELEGATAQLGLFDALPEGEQRDLLDAVVEDSSSLDAESRKLADAWRTGDMETIEQETRRGMLADPELRTALFTLRNHDWAQRITDMMADGARPFVAVGAAHMAGPDGLPALLEAKGYTVTRIQ